MPPTDEAPQASDERAASDPRPCSEEAARSSIPTPDPSDPDADLYAALRARPDWTEKPAVKAAIEELARDVPPGQDLFYWPVAKPGEVKESDAQAHVAIAGGEVAPIAGSTGLESRRVYVAPTADARQLATVRSSGRNGPASLGVEPVVIVGLARATSGLRPPVAAARATDPKAAAVTVLETTLLSSPAAVRRSPGSHSTGRWTWGLRVAVGGVALGVVALGLWRMGGSNEPSASLTATATATASVGAAAFGGAGAVSAGARAEALSTGRAGGASVQASGAATSPVGVASSPSIPSAPTVTAARTAVSTASATRTFEPRIVAVPSPTAAASSALPVASSIEVDTGPPVASSAAPGPPAPTWTRVPAKPGPRVPEARPEF